MTNFFFHNISKNTIQGMDMQRHPGGDGEDNFGFDMEAPKSPWRYPHLMFRTDSRKNKAVSFKQNPGKYLKKIAGNAKKKLSKVYQI